MGEKATTPKLRFETRRPPSALKADGERAPLPETGKPNTDAHERQKQAVRRDYTQAAQHAEPVSASIEEPALHSSARLQFDEPHPLPVMDGDDERAAFPTADETAVTENAHERQKRSLRRDYVQAKQTAAASPGAGENAGVGENIAPAVERKPGRLHFDDELPPPSALIQGERMPVAKPPKAGEGSTRARRAQSDNPAATNRADGPGRLHFEKDQPKKPSALRQTASAAVREAFREHANAEADDNAGLDAANAGERAAGSLARSARNHAIQKRAIRKGYALAKSGRDSAFVTSAAQQAVYTPAERAARRLASFGQHMRGKAVILLLALMLFFMMNSLSSCAPLVEAGLQAIVMGTYPAEEADILAAENAYSEMERALQDELDNYALYHPDYDEVEIEQMDIWHDPYALIALISAHFDGEAWTIDDAMPFLERLFEQQYELTETAASEQRYQTVDGEQVWFTHTVCKVKLTNKNLSHLPFMVLSRQQVSLYAMYMSTLGNMPELFAGEPHASQLKDPLLYDVPEETLNADPNFAALIAEAEKYIGYPYVWGGSEPDTSFDCSGFISWIFTKTGVCNIGRLGATGLYNACEKIQPEEARPGDLIFFTGTLGEGEDGNDGITHVGLYVGDESGNGMMLHCGNPISYADLSRTYWQEHFYGFGRLY